MSIKNKLILFSLTVTLSMGGGIYISHKFNDSKNKQYNESVEKLASDESYIEVVVDSLKTSFNNTGKFEVMNGELQINHTYKYIEDPITFKNVFTGKEETIFEPTIIKAGSAIALFDFDIESLNDCEIKVQNSKSDDVTIEILVPYPKLDEESVHRKKDSFDLDKSKTSISFSAKVKLIGQSVYTKYKETMDARATRGLEDDIDRITPSKIQEAYETDKDRIYELESKTVNSVHALADGFLTNILKSVGVSENFKIEVKLKESKLPDNYKTDIENQ